MSPGFLITILLTFGGALVGLFNPYYGLLVYMSLAILRPESLWFWSVPGDANFSRIVACCLLVGWVAQELSRWRQRHPDLPTPTSLVGFSSQPFFFTIASFTGKRLDTFGRERGIVAALLGFMALAIVGAFLAPNQSVAWDFVESMAKIILPFLVGITSIDSVKKLKQLAWLLVLCQGYVALELNRSYLSGFNRLTEAGFGGMDNNCVAIAMVTAIGLGFFLGLEAPTLWRKGLALFAVACMAHAVLFSFSRGSMLALIITGVVAFFLIPKQPRHYAVFAVAVVFCLLLAGTEVRERFLTIFTGKEERDASAESRLVLWSNCLDSIAEHPLLGVGPNHWPLVVHRYGWNKGKEAHTLWLQLGAELGLPALACLLAFFGLAVVRLWPLARDKCEVPDPWLRSAARMVIAALVGFVISAQFVSLKTLELPYYVTLLGAGAVKLSTRWSSAAAMDPTWETMPTTPAIEDDAQAVFAMQGTVVWSSSPYEGQEQTS